MDQTTFFDEFGQQWNNNSRISTGRRCVTTECERFCMPIKSKSKTTKKGTCWLQLREELEPMLNQGNIRSPIMKYLGKMHLLRHGSLPRNNDGVSKLKRFSSELFCAFWTMDPMKNGKPSWQEVEETRRDTRTVRILQEQLFISELFKNIKEAIFLTLHRKKLYFFRTTSSSTSWRMCNQFAPKHLYFYIPSRGLEADKMVAKLEHHSNRGHAHQNNHA